MVRDLVDGLTPEVILDKLVDLTKPFPEVRGIRLLCQGCSQEAIVCVIDANQQSWRVADAIGGFMYGGMPARTIAPLAAGFRCAGRPEGKLMSAFCAKCYVISDSGTGASKQSSV